MKIFGREPALWIAVLAGGVDLLATLGWDGLSTHQAALIVAAVNAVAAAVTAALTRPIAPSAFTGVVAAVAALLAGYQLDVSQATVGAVNTLVLAVLFLLTRGQVTPAAEVSTRLGE